MRAFDKEKGDSFPLPLDYEYIPCEQMAEFPVVALWGNENAELLFLISLVWELFVRGVGGENGTHGSLETSCLKFILQAKMPILKYDFPLWMHM